MKRKLWFAGKTGTHGGDALFQSFLRLVARVRAVPAARPVESRRTPAADSGAEPCWTAALHRGDSLPPFRLSILNTEDSLSPMRMEPCRRDPGRPNSADL
ncbi:hypothetical protein [Rhodoblastus sp.]|uniref:hypothetical protein n=1 Tax=Rhodoblastus sp. TaxID=1962975 RepID=UPI003F97BD30